MHVRHIVRQFAPMIGGLEDATAQLAAHLQRDHAITCSVVTLDRAFGDRTRQLPPEDEYLGIPVRRIPFSGSPRYPLAPKVLAALDGADIVHVHGIDFFFDFLSATRAWHRRPLVASTHGGFFHTDFASTAKRLWLQSVTRASACGYRRIFGSSEADTSIFRQIAPRQTITIENGVNIAKWSGAGASDPTPTMIFIGRFSVNKDVPTLIRLIAALGAPWRLIVAGQTSDLSAQDLHAEAAAHNVSDRVLIHVAPDDEAMLALLGQASYVASASRYEGFGLSVVEGMSAGLTPLLAPIAPFQKLVERTRCGAILSLEDLGKAARAVRALHEQQNITTREANMTAAAGFGWTGVAEQFAKEYRMVLANDTIVRPVRGMLDRSR